MGGNHPRLGQCLDRWFYFVGKTNAPRTCCVGTYEASSSAGANMMPGFGPHDASHATAPNL